MFKVKITLILILLPFLISATSSGSELYCDKPDPLKHTVDENSVNSNQNLRQVILSLMNQKSLFSDLDPMVCSDENNNKNIDELLRELDSLVKEYFINKNYKKLHIEPLLDLIKIHEKKISDLVSSKNKEKENRVALKVHEFELTALKSLLKITHPPGELMVDLSAFMAKKIGKKTKNSQLGEASGNLEAFLSGTLKKIKTKLGSSPKSLESPLVSLQDEKPVKKDIFLESLIPKKSERLVHLKAITGGSVLGLGMAGCVVDSVTMGTASWIIPTIGSIAEGAALTFELSLGSTDKRIQLISQALAQSKFSKTALEASKVGVGLGFDLGFEHILTSSEAITTEAVGAGLEKAVGYLPFLGCSYLIVKGTKNIYKAVKGPEPGKEVLKLKDEFNSEFLKSAVQENKKQLDSLLNGLNQISDLLNSYPGHFASKALLGVHRDAAHNAQCWLQDFKEKSEKAYLKRLKYLEEKIDQKEKRNNFYNELKKLAARSEKDIRKAHAKVINNSLQSLWQNLEEEHLFYLDALKRLEVPVGVDLSVTERFRNLVNLKKHKFFPAKNLAPVDDLDEVKAILHLKDVNQALSEKILSKEVEHISSLNLKNARAAINIIAHTVTEDQAISLPENLLPEKLLPEKLLKEEPSQSLQRKGLYPEETIYDHIKKVEPDFLGLSIKSIQTAVLEENKNIQEKINFFEQSISSIKKLEKNGLNKS